MTYGLPSLGLVSALGSNRDEVWDRLFESPRTGLSDCSWVIGRDSVKAGAVETELPEIPRELSHLDCRNNRLALKALASIESEIETLIDEYGTQRVGVVAGTSTSGIRSGEVAVEDWASEGSLPEDFHYSQMEMGGLSHFIRGYYDLNGPAYTISTACSSSAKVFASARELLAMDLVDAVIVGGSDALCKLTLNGFNSLQLLSESICNPMAENRDGINIGEGAAFFLMTRGGGPVELAGVGESSDAHSMNAPDPEGIGAETSMNEALGRADLPADALDYLNLHGTGTRQNDAMESKAVHRLFGSDLPCASTKAFLGHTLGASGALETAICWMMLDRADGGSLPVAPHLWEGPYDGELEPLNLTEEPHRIESEQPHYVMTNSFAFGGHNCSVLLKRGAFQ